MESRTLRYFQIAACSLFGMASIACARLNPLETAAAQVRERPFIPGATSGGLDEEAQLAALQEEIDRVEGDLGQLRLALDRMGGRETGISEANTLRVGDRGAAAVSVDPDLYSEPPRLEGSKSLFYEADLAAYPSRAAAQAAWSDISSRIHFTGLSPRLVDSAEGVRLNVGPMTSRASVEALCAELVSLTPACRVAGAASLPH